MGSRAVGCVALCLCMAIGLTSATASACSFPGPEAHELDPESTPGDVEPPKWREAPGLSVERGQGPESSGCGESAITSCDGTGRATFFLDAGDDHTSNDDVGYTLRLHSGTLPSGASLPEEATRLFQGAFHLVWSDGATDDQEAFDFTLAITPRDLAGNEGEELLVRVDAGSRGGCAIARPGSSNLLSFSLTLLCWVALGRVRRRGRPYPPSRG